MSKNSRKYDEEFKKRSVRMSYSSDRPITEVSKSLVITLNMIYLWRKKYTPRRPEILPSSTQTAVTDGQSESQR